ncbi:MAG TPA: hypothetical protein VNZ94_10370 [Xanthobacteraceae bacterium]|nr:hypothetical protein [Xanthobacteraceae bacterium]
MMTMPPAKASVGRIVWADVAIAARNVYQQPARGRCDCVAAGRPVICFVAASIGAGPGLVLVDVRRPLT